MRLRLMIFGLLLAAGCKSEPKAYCFRVDYALGSKTACFPDRTDCIKERAERKAGGQGLRYYDCQPTYSKPHCYSFAVGDESTNYLRCFVTDSECYEDRAAVEKSGARISVAHDCEGN